jgi:hypothetical protein
VEAAFTFIFWAMYSVGAIGSEPYVGEHLCIWGRGALEWDGLCTHNPLMEPLGPDVLLTEAQLATKYMDLRERKRIGSRKFRGLNHERKRRLNRESYARTKDKNREKVNKRERQNWANNERMKRLRAGVRPRIALWLEGRQGGTPHVTCARWCSKGMESGAACAKESPQGTSAIEGGGRYDGCVVERKGSRVARLGESQLQG